MHNSQNEHKEGHTAMDWMDTFHRETAAVVTEPFFCCLCEAIAMVESGRGRWPILGEEGLNEIGYKALAGHPSRPSATCESTEAGLRPAMADFRLFADRGEQARALAWLMRSSRFYEAARLLYLLAFYAAYAPGRDEGARAVARAFNERARTGLHPGVVPIGLIGGQTLDPAERALNHEAARRAVRLFAEMTRAEETATGGRHG